MRAPRAESDANSEFIRALDYGIGSDTVQADGRQNQRQNRKSRKQRGDQSAARPYWLLLDPCLQVVDLVGLLVWIHRRHLLSNAVQNGVRRDAAADKNLRAHPHLKRVRGKDLRRDRFLDTVVSSVSYNTNDLQPAIRARSSHRPWRIVEELRQLERMPQHIAVWVIASRKGLIHQHQAKRRASLPLHSKCDPGQAASAE